MREYGVPYMGSKDKIAASIAMNFPKAENFYDLFGGGFSMTHYMLMRRSKHYQHFHYNEIKADMVELVKQAIAGKFNYNVFKPEWISREEFFAKKDTDAYVRCLWSFGNNQKGYLFGRDIEPYKRSMHQAVVFGEFDDLASEVLAIKEWPAGFKTITQKRMYLRQKIDQYRKTKIPKVFHQFLNLKQLQQLERLKQLQQLERLKQLQQLAQLERLQQLQQLERLERLTFSALDYRKVEIKPNSIVYCDIPYLGTVDYNATFNHKEFYEWAMTRPFPVYISEYSLPDPRFKVIYSVDKRSLLFKVKSVGNKSEKLFWNGI